MMIPYFSVKITNLLIFRVLLKEKSVANFDFGLVMQGDNKEIKKDNWSLVPVMEITRR